MSGGYVDAADGSAVPMDSGATHAAGIDYPTLPVPEHTAPPTDPLDDIRPMSVEEARQMLFEKCSMAIAPDDPLLMAVLLHQGFCKDLAKVNHATINQIEAMLQSTGNSYADTVEQLFNELKKTGEQASIAHAIALVKDFTQAFEANQRAMKRHTILMTVLTLLALGSIVLPIAFS